MSTSNITETDSTVRNETSARRQTNILYPYTTLFRSARARGRRAEGRAGPPAVPRSLEPRVDQGARARDHGDRKSTRLNSSHLGISYAVFCLKKKKFDSPPTEPKPSNL